MTLIVDDLLFTDILSVLDSFRKENSKFLQINEIHLLKLSQWLNDSSIENNEYITLDLNFKENYLLIVNYLTFKKEIQTHKHSIDFILKIKKLIVIDENLISAAVMSAVRNHEFLNIKDLKIKVLDYLHFKLKVINLQINRNQTEPLFLKSEVVKKANTIRDFISEENEKKINEKKLLFFLDFLNLEHGKPDFLEKMSLLIWSDVQKFSRLISFGFYMKSNDSDGILFSYDTKGLNVNVLDNRTNIFEHLSAQFLADFFQRPFGPTFFWQPKKDSFLVSNKNFSIHNSMIYFEMASKGEKYNLLENYILERIQLIFVAIERHLTQMRTNYHIEKWNIFSSAYGSPMHVVDQNFNLIKANYKFDDIDNIFDKKIKCYNILAQLDSPCQNCPIVLNKNSDIFLSKKKYKVYLNNFDIDKKYYLNFYEPKLDYEKLRSEIIQNEKMQAIGNLANHLSHNLSNPLTGLKLMTEYIGNQLNDNDIIIKNDLNEVLKGISRSQIIIHDLTQFSESHQAKLEPLFVKDVVNRALSLLKTLLKSKRIFTELKNCQIKAHAGLLQQVFFNLVKNSCEALDDKGIIKIYDIDSMPHYDIICEDNGPGISDDLKESLFLPFTSNKSDNEGTGLGLYLSKSILNKMNADLFYDFQFKNGARFILRFYK